MRYADPWLSAAVAICVPTLNAGHLWKEWLTLLQPVLRDTHLLVIDSSSEDETPELARQAGAEVVVIPRSDFNHGGTRDMALRRLTGYDVVVFLTQDALIDSPDSLRKLVATFEDPRVGAVYGRQLPHQGASPLARHARHFNYPGESRVVSPNDVSRLGLKAAFLSNAFAAYRREALLGVGGFPTDVILSEDMMAGARLLRAGWKLVYCSEATVRHSHDYTIGEEFRRYFDIGVFHAREAWLLEWLGKAEGEGARFVCSEVAYLVRHAPWRLPEATLRTLLKYAGYRLGKMERHLPSTWKQRLSMNKRYWD